MLGRPRGTDQTTVSSQPPTMLFMTCNCHPVSDIDRGQRVFFSFLFYKDQIANISGFFWPYSCLSYYLILMQHDTVIHYSDLGWSKLNFIYKERAVRFGPRPYFANPDIQPYQISSRTHPIPLTSSSPTPKLTTLLPSYILDQFCS